MKIFAALLLLISGSVSALQVTNVVYNQQLDQLEVQVLYNGGCFEHRFEMNLVNCEISNTQNIGVVNVCDAKIIDVTGKEDRCQAMIKRQLNISLSGLSNEVRPVLVGFESGVVLVPRKS
ncbi:MAG: hypothetical protein WCK49_00275 [Myxococcaceae bacterium]